MPAKVRTKKVRQTPTKENENATALAREQVGSKGWYEQQWHMQWHQLEEKLRYSTKTAEIQLRKFKTDRSYTKFQTLIQENSETRTYLQALFEALHANPGYGPELVNTLKEKVETSQANNSRGANNGSNDDLQGLLAFLGVQKIYINYNYAHRNTAACLDVLTQLATFAESVFAFFQAGFYPESQQGQSEQEQPQELQQLLAGMAQESSFLSEKYPANFVLRLLLDRVTHDLNLLSRVGYQLSQLSKISATEDTLLFASTLGHRALAPARKAGLLDNRYQSVIAYQEHRVEIRLLPYHNTVLLGMPLTASVLSKAPNATPKVQGDDQQIQEIIDELKQLLPSKPAMDYLAIPHEIGHVVYRFGRDFFPEGKIHLPRLIRNRLLAQPHGLAKDDWRFEWIEELFSDAYGCVVAGPISALGFQMMLADGLSPQYQEESDHYPSPVLRPLIQSEILRHIRDASGNVIYPEAPNLLDARWQDWVTLNWPSWLEDRWTGNATASNFILDAEYTVQGRIMNGAKILAELQPVIAVLLQTLEKVQPQSEAQTWTPGWDHTLYEDEEKPFNEKLTGLYERFCDFAQLAGLETVFADVIETEADEAPPAKMDIFELLGQLQNKRAMRGGIDPLVEMILFEGWSEEGPSMANDQ